MYNLLGYSDDRLKTQGSLFLYYRDEPITNTKNYKLLRFKLKVTGYTNAEGTKENEIAALLKRFGKINFSETIGMPLGNCEINLLVTWYNCVIAGSTGASIFTTADTILYVPVVRLSLLDNSKLLQKLKSELKKQLTGININQICQ